MTPMATEPVLALDDIQGNSVVGFRKGNQSFAFLRVDAGDGAADRARSWLRGLGPQLSDARQVLEHNRTFRAARQGEAVAAATLGAAAPVVWVNVALAAACLVRFGLDVREFDDDGFRVGLAKRSPLLNDPADPASSGHPGQWQVGGSNPCDAVVIAASDERDACLARLDALVTEATGSGWVLVHRIDGADLPGDLKGHEHFGFRDGISMPVVRGRASDAADDFVAPRGAGTAAPGFARAGQQLLWPGQVLLGQPRQDPRDPGATIQPTGPAGPAWSTNGSYLVIRKLTQDVEGFWRFVRRHAPKVDTDPVRFASMLVGRWPSGAPLSLSPHADDPGLATDGDRVNDFAFGDDGSGVRCPLAAHVRKVNPRDITTEQGGANDTFTRQFLRRGIPFTEPDGRGLLFAAYMSSIVEQFEFVQRTWTNSDELPEHGSGHDLIIGQRQEGDARARRITLTDASGKAVTVRTLQDFVTPVGGEYFLAPPISAFADPLGRP